VKDAAAVDCDIVGIDVDVARWTEMAPLLQKIPVAIKNLDADVATIAVTLDHLIENGFDEMPHALEILLNAAMKLERSEFLGAGPYERSARRQGYAIDVAKMVKSRSSCPSRSAEARR